MASHDHEINSFKEVCQKEVITFSRLWEEHTQEEARLIIREEKMGATEDQALMIQRRSLKQWWIWRTQFLKSLLSILIIWIRNDAIMNKEYDGVERSLPMKQIKISIQLSFHDIVVVMHLFIFSWCIMHDRMFASMTIY